MEGSLALNTRNQQEVQNALLKISSGIDEAQYLATNSTFKADFETTITGSIEQEWSSGHKFKFVKDEKIDDDLFNEENDKRANNAGYLQMLKARQSLPAYKQKEILVNKIKDNKVVLVSGEAGCGKTTQIPQFVLENCIDRRIGSQTYIVCTQPRRISAIAVAQRVAKERGEDLCNSVGYQIQLEKYMPRERGGILFCTTGILLRYMMSDPLLTQVSHILVDEVHERDINSDFLLTLLRDLIQCRDDLRVIVMSASLNSRKFSEYFRNCPIVDIPGKMFPVKELFLEDVLQLTRYRYVPNTKYRPTPQEKMQKDKELEKLEHHLSRLSCNYSPEIIEAVKSIEVSDAPLDLVVELVSYIHRNKQDKTGAILVFLTGWGAIDIVTSGLERKFQFSSTRKIILSTNLAETSITIDDVVYVIDGGKIKVGNYDTKAKISTLDDEWTSKASSDQRKGRAGRVQNGICYRLYTKGRQDFFHKDIVPEIHRSSLEQVILQAKLLKLGHVAPFFRKLMDTPSLDALSIATQLLKNLNALDRDEKLTPLGYHLAQMQIEPNLAKMLILGALFSCFDPIASIAACLSFRDPFPMPKKNEDAALKQFKRMKSGDQKSDHILLARIVSDYEQTENLSEFCKEYKVNNFTMKHISALKAKLTERVYDMHFLLDSTASSKENNINSGNIAIIKAVICGGLYPNIAVITELERGRYRIVPKLISPGTNEKLTIHRKSVIENAELGTSRYVTYYKKMRYGKNNQLHDCSVINPMPILFFCNNLTSSSLPSGVYLTIDNSLKFKCSTNLAQTIKELRRHLDLMLEHKVNYPEPIDLESDSTDARVLKAMITLFKAENDEKFF